MLRPSLTLKILAAVSSETSVNLYYAVWRHNSEDRSDLHIFCRDNLRSR